MAVGNERNGSREMNFSIRRITVFVLLLVIRVKYYIYINVLLIF